MAKSRPITASAAADQAASPDAINPFDLPAAASVSPDAPPPAVESTEPVARPPRKAAAAAEPAVIAAMQSQIDHLQRLVETLVANQGSTPAAAPQAPTMTEAEWQAKIGEIHRPNDVRSQEVVDRTFQRRPDDKLFDVQLLDKPERKNGEDIRVAGVFPKLRIPAEREADARGRYQEVCGILSTGDAGWFIQQAA